MLGWVVLLVLQFYLRRGEGAEQEEEEEVKEGV